MSDDWVSINGEPKAPPEDPGGLQEQLEALIERMRCYSCKEKTDRFIAFRTVVGVIETFECLDCRQKRVAQQVAEGRRPASDLDPENLPERRNPDWRAHE